MSRHAPRAVFFTLFLLQLPVFYAKTPNSLDALSANLGLIGAGFALIVVPGDLDLIALLAALELEGQVGIARDRRPPVGLHHLFSVAGRRHFMNEMCRYGIALVVLAQAGLHDVTHQHLDLGDTIFLACADAHWPCHGSGLLLLIGLTGASNGGHQPPQPPSVTLTSL